jgi:hypothetical protein
MAANLECVDRVVRTIANLDDLEVEEIFQRVAMLPPISSALLQNMRATLSDMYEASRDTSESKEELPRRRSLHLQPKKKTSVTRRSTRTKARRIWGGRTTTATTLPLKVNRRRRCLTRRRRTAVNRSPPQRHSTPQAR